MLTKRQKNIYLDYAATTPVDLDVIESMSYYWSDNFGNPSSQHYYGQKAQIVVDKAKDSIASTIGCNPREIIFTSGATESNNLAIKGAVIANDSRGEKVPHIITTQMEHESVLSACKQMEGSGVATFTYIKPNKEGVISEKDIESSIRQNTILVSVMYVNNETGSIQPVKKIGKLIRSINKSRNQKILFHTDSVQALNFCNCHVNYTKADMMSFSAHKIYGPKGIGVLYIKQGTDINPILNGGNQQYGIRPGTLPVPLIVGCAKAFEKTPHNKLHGNDVMKLKKRLVIGIKNSIPESEINGPEPDSEHSSPYHLNMYFPKIDGTTLMNALDMSGVSVSYGSACATGGKQKSHVLTAMGLSKERVSNSIRITLGIQTTSKEVDQAIQIISKTYKNIVATQ